MTRSKWFHAVFTVVLMAAAAVFLERTSRRMQLGNPGLRMVNEPVFCEDGSVVNTNTVALPERVLDYNSTSKPISAAELRWLPKDTTYARRLYQRADRDELWLNVVLMGTDRGSIHKPEICLVGQGWQIDRSDLLSVPIERPHAYDLPVMRLLASRRVATRDGRTFDQRAVYVYWFVAENQLTARHGERMWWMARDLLTTGILPRWAYVSCLAGCLPGEEQALYQRLRDFIRAAVPEFQTASGPHSR
jgi:hypothetical protein